jgi:hypothetical protein
MICWAEAGAAMAIDPIAAAARSAARTYLMSFFLSSIEMDARRNLPISDQFLSSNMGQHSGNF